ncbi:MAG TPA: HD-GYP domain-containing protein [Gemmatimonadaceae bacterium]|nr:HD-GYP domain-containing protein [Gemmatimonadaceae bacterium]
MSERAVKFLTGMAQALSTMALYKDGHPARERVIDLSYQRLTDLQTENPHPIFSFLGQDLIYGVQSLRELGDWDWSPRFTNAGVQRMEFPPGVSRVEYDAFLSDVLGRLQVGMIVDTATASPERRQSIRFGAIGVRGTEGATLKIDEPLPTATITYTLGEEAETIRWLHQEVTDRGELPMLEVDSIVGSLSVAMHADREIVIPLVQLKEFDQYTTTHSLNVSVLAMALAEFMGMGQKDVRGFGVAGLLHDLGKVRIPKDVLTKPGKLTDEEWVIMRKHPVDGAKLIYESDRMLDLAATVAYEHHIMLNGGGYPERHFARECHHASKIVHICDVYDALRTNRPYRAAWEAEKVLAHMQKGAGDDFDPEIVNAFTTMMRQWEKRVAVVDDKSAIPQIAEAAQAAAAQAAAAPSGSSAATPQPAEAPPPASPAP